jgi:hypothetical protein
VPKEKAPKKQSVAGSSELSPLNATGDGSVVSRRRDVGVTGTVVNREMLGRLHSCGRGPAPLLVRKSRNVVVLLTPPVTDPLMIRVTSIKVHMVVGSVGRARGISIVHRT